jgi:hypothetical protein
MRLLAFSLPASNLHLLLPPPQPNADRTTLLVPHRGLADLGSLLVLSPLYSDA